MRKLVVKILEKLGLYTFCVKLWNRMKHRKMSRIMRKYGLDTLVRLDAAFTEMGTQMFLLYGTLLGAYRDHGFIPYDFDLDVGVMAGTLPENYRSVILKHGFRFVRQDYVKENNFVILEKYERNGLVVDVLFAVAYDDDTYGIYASRHHEYKEWRAANATDGFPVECQLVDKCGFVRKDFLGHEFYMPEKVTDWLRDIYTANYMTPVKNFDDDTPERRVIFPVEFRSYRKYE